MTQSDLEAAFAFQLHALGLLGECQREWRWHPTRRWRWDFCWPEHMLAVELQGGTYTQGRHTRGAGYRDDCEKANDAVVLGWRLLRFTGDQVNDGSAVQVVSDALARDWTPGGL